MGRYDLAGLLLTSFNEKGVEIINDAIETHCKLCKDKKSDKNVCFELYITKYLMTRVLNDLKNSTVLNPPLQQSDFVSTNDPFINQVVKNNNDVYEQIKDTKPEYRLTFTNALRSLNYPFSGSGNSITREVAGQGVAGADVRFYQNNSLTFVREIKCYLIYMKGDYRTKLLDQKGAIKQINFVRKINTIPADIFTQLTVINISGAMININHFRSKGLTGNFTESDLANITGTIVGPDTSAENKGVFAYRESLRN